MGSHTGVAVASSLEELGMVAAEPGERKGEEEGERKWLLEGEDRLD